MPSARCSQLSRDPLCLSIAIRNCLGGDYTHQRYAHDFALVPLVKLHDSPSQFLHA